VCLKWSTQDPWVNAKHMRLIAIQLFNEHASSQSSPPTVSTGLGLSWNELYCFHFHFLTRFWPGVRYWFSVCADLILAVFREARGGLLGRGSRTRRA
jgi:hypothetical protein